MNYHRLHRLKKQITQITLTAIVFCLAVTLVGCDAFVRKFTRKPKKEELPKEEMVLAPQEYKAPEVTKEELYSRYFLFWKSWQTELIESLSQSRSLKKQIDCAQEAIKNLSSLKELLKDEAQKKLEAYLGQLEELKDEIKKDLSGTRIIINAREAERLKMKILRDLSYAKIKESLL